MARGLDPAEAACSCGLGAECTRSQPPIGGIAEQMRGIGADRRLELTPAGGC
jgi:hypothetical protein